MSMLREKGKKYSYIFIYFEAFFYFTNEVFSLYDFMIFVYLRVTELSKSNRYLDINPQAQFKPRTNIRLYENICYRLPKPQYDINRFIPAPTDFVDILNNYTLDEIIDIYHDAGLNEEAESFATTQNQTLEYLTGPINQSLELIPKIKLRSSTLLDNQSLDTYLDVLISDRYTRGAKGIKLYLFR